MKTAIVYYSKHHGNTKKLINALAAKYDITAIDALEVKTADLSGYDMVGFASGIYYSKFHKSVLEFAQQNLPEGKKVFFLYTYGAEKKGVIFYIQIRILKQRCVVTVTVCNYPRRNDRLTVRIFQGLRLHRIYKVFIIITPRAVYNDESSVLKTYEYRKSVCGTADRYGYHR